MVSALTPALGVILRSQFTPLRYQPTLWIDAQLSQLRQNSNGTTAATADADPVGYISDLSGTGNHPIQATAGLRPLLKLGANGINGLPCLLWDATDDLLRVTFGAAVAQPITAYWVGSFGSAAGTFRIAFDSSADTGAFALFLSDGNTVHYQASTDLDSGDAASGVQMYSVVFNGASSSLRQNAVQIHAGNVGTASLPGVTVGATRTGTVPLGGKVGALLVCPGAHTVSQQVQIEQYYKTRGYW